jgi:hypothetical protein
MRYWLVTFAIAVVVVAGYAVGLLGLVLAAIAFGAALFLLWADELGFSGAWLAFGFDRFDAPASGANWDQFAAVTKDADKVAKAATIALSLTAAWLMLPEELMLIGILVSTGWAALRINKRHPSAPPKTAALPQTPLRANLAPPSAQPMEPAMAREPTVATDARTATATIAADSPVLRRTMSSASTLALLARGRYRSQRVRRRPKQAKRQVKARPARKPSRHLPLHQKLPLGRRPIRRPKRALQSGLKLQRNRKPSS